MQRLHQQIANLPPEERCQILQLVDAFIERRLVRERLGKLSAEDQRSLRAAIEQISG